MLFFPVSVRNRPVHNRILEQTTFVTELFIIITEPFITDHVHNTVMNVVSYEEVCFEKEPFFPFYYFTSLFG